MRTIKLKYCYILAVLLATFGVISAKNLVVASYNLWNVMFQWHVRKHFIAEKVRYVIKKELIPYF